MSDTSRCQKPSDVKHEKQHLAAYQLGQDPSSGFGLWRNLKSIHAIIKNVGVPYVPAAGRWMTPNEVLRCQGFPVGVAAAAFKNATSFSKHRDTRRRDAVKGQAGNAMCVPVLGALLLFIAGTVCINRPSSGCDESQLATASKFGAMLVRSKRRKQ